MLFTADDNGTYLVTCPDLPEVTTFGETVEEAMRMAKAAIAEAIAALLARFDDIPEPSTPVVDVMPRVALDLQSSLTATLLWHLKRSGKTGPT